MNAPAARPHSPAARRAGRAACCPHPRCTASARRGRGGARARAARAVPRGWSSTSATRPRPMAPRAGRRGHRRSAEAVWWLRRRAGSACRSPCGPVPRPCCSACPRASSRAACCISTNPGAAPARSCSNAWPKPPAMRGARRAARCRAAPSPSRRGRRPRAGKARPASGRAAGRAADRGARPAGAPLREVAEAVGLGERRLQQLFHAQVGLSPRAPGAGSRACTTACARYVPRRCRPGPRSRSTAASMTSRTWSTSSARCVASRPPSSWAARLRVLPRRRREGGATFGASFLSAS